jgi:tRNA uridine 5-carbamoylmethylation protein Kti12
MIIVTGAPYSGKTTLCQLIEGAVELSVNDAIKKARELEELNEHYSVIFLYCSKSILINRVMDVHGQQSLKHVATVMDYNEPPPAMLKVWFQEFSILHTDGGINEETMGELHASHYRRTEIPAGCSSTPELLQRTH